MHSYEALYSTHLNIILPTVLWHRIRNKTTHLYSFFPCLTLSWLVLIIFRILIIETKLDFVSFNDKNLQRRRKFVAERDFPILIPYTGQVSCMSQSKAQKCLTLLVESAIWFTFLVVSLLYVTLQKILMLKVLGRIRSQHSITEREARESRACLKVCNKNSCVCLFAFFLLKIKSKSTTKPKK